MSVAVARSRILRVPALTLPQPWASLAAEGLVGHLIRGWRPPRPYVFGRLALHAAARPATRDEIDALLAALRAPRFGEVHGQGLAPLEAAITRLEAWRSAPLTLPIGAVLAEATLGWPVAATTLPGARGRRVDPALWAWPLNHVAPRATPIPARGGRGIWMWAPERHVDREPA